MQCLKYGHFRQVITWNGDNIKQGICNNTCSLTKERCPLYTGETYKDDHYRQVTSKVIRSLKRGDLNKEVIKLTTVDK